MADPLHAETPEPPPDQPPAPEPPPEDPAAELERLRNENRRYADREKIYNDTLEALGRNRETPSPGGATAPGPGVSSVSPATDHDMIRAIAQETGLDEASVEPYVRVARAAFNRLAAPAVSTLVGLADNQSRLEARLSVEDWKDIEDETVKIVNQYRSRGVFLDYKSASEIARSRIAPRKAAQRDVDAAVDQNRRTHAATVTTPSPRAIDTAGSRSRATPSRPLSAQEIAALPKDQRDKALEEALKDATF